MTYLKGIVFKMLTFCLLVLVFVHKQEGELSLGLPVLSIAPIYSVSKIFDQTIKMLLSSAYLTHM